MSAFIWLVLLSVVVVATAAIDTVATTFTNGKFVATSHTTLQPFSKIQCVEKCHQEERKGMCSLAAYNKATKTCYLSTDSQQDVVDVSDESVGVFFLQGTQ